MGRVTDECVDERTIEWIPNEHVVVTRARSQQVVAESEYYVNGVRVTYEHKAAYASGCVPNTNVVVV